MNRNQWLLRSLALCIALTLAVGACSSTKSAQTQVDDAAITARVKAKLAADGDINPFNIDVDTNLGVVTLQGRVKKEDYPVQGRAVRTADGRCEEGYQPDHRGRQSVSVAPSS